MANINLGMKKLAYGGDWNPEQWDREVWEEDVKLFKKAGIDLLSINIFSWTLNQPDEESWNFQWLDDVIALLKNNDMKVCLGTSTAAHPAWMATKYPDILRVDFKGRKRKYGDRHNSCPSSPTYRKFAFQMASQLAHRYKDEETIVLWHVSNEFGGSCYCENCEQKFRDWLKKHYTDLDSLNKAWNTRFWSQSYTDWDQIVLPNELTVQWEVKSTANQPLVLDYNRFNSENILECYTLERDAIKNVIPEALVTTNFMTYYRPLNYREWAKEIDIISWDNYPHPEHKPSFTAMMHGLMRSLKHGQSFLLLEQTPSQTNWQKYNSLKRPGVMRLYSYQAAAHGADSIMFFQMRRSRAACEKFHGAVIEHSGRSDTRVFIEVETLGQELKKLEDTFLGSTIEAEVAVWFDWESWWAVENSMGPNADLDYVAEVHKCYHPFHEKGVSVDLVGPDSDLSQYKILMAPLLYMIHPGVAEKLSHFVKNGGTLLTSFLSGVADVNDKVFLGGAPGPLKELLGIWEEEIDALAPEQYNRIVLEKPLGPIKGEYKCNLLFSLIHLDDAEAIASYGDDFYACRPVLTRKKSAKGEAWYLASSGDEKFMNDLVDYFLNQHKIQSILQNIPKDVEVTQRKTEDGKSVFFILNHNDNKQALDLGKTQLTNLLTGVTLKETIQLLAKDVVIASD